MPDSHEPLLRPRDYRRLLSFQKAEVVYDLTVVFCRRFLAKDPRTTSQMVQAARSGKKNILEGSKAGLTSKQTEIHLTNVARASLEELLDDYRDFLRTHQAPLWELNSPEARFVRQLGARKPQTFELYREYAETRPGPVVANIALCLIHQANYLIDRQNRTLAQEFLEQGGFRERMHRLRSQHKSTQNPHPQDSP